MIETAIKRVYGDAAPDALRARRMRRRTDFLLGFAALVIALGVMPLIYGASLVNVPFVQAMSGDSLKHILWNAGANAAVMLSVLKLKARFDRKIAAVLSRALVVHGALAFVTLMLHQAHSNQVMLLALAASIILGCLTVLLRHQTLHSRAALVGDWHPACQSLGIPCDHITDPEADLSAYDVVLTASVHDLNAEWAAAISRAMLSGRSVRLLAEFAEEDQGLVSLEHFDLEHLPAAGLTSYRTRKRIMDVGLVLLALPIALPLLLIGAILVLCTMGRPVFFVQSRVGLGGAPFQMFKLRTMRMPSDADKQATSTSSRSDVRITPVGRWLRRFRIDELPQLLNVLLGQMSIIGPRPEWTLLSEGYAESLPAYAYRNLVRPGITGWAQVRGGYASTLAETREKVGYDLFYIKNLSFSLDVQILVRTIWTLLSGYGAR